MWMWISAPLAGSRNRGKVKSMLANEITERVLDVIAKTQHLELEKVTAYSTFAELNIDSLDGLQIMFALEEEFGITIPDDAAKKFTSVQQAIDGISSLLTAKGTKAAEVK